jgi:hypothetical protein
MTFTWEEYGITVTIDKDNNTTFEHDEALKIEAQIKQYEEEQENKYY